MKMPHALPWIAAAIASVLPLKSAVNVPLLVNANDQFAIDLYRDLIANTLDDAASDGNLVFSPFSASTALAMAWGGARGETATEMENTLHFDLLGDDVHASFGALQRDLSALMETAPEPVRFEIANGLWMRQNGGFRTDYRALVEDNYQAELAEVDFVGDPDGSREWINDWVEAQTEDRIQNLLAPSDVTSDTYAVLVNALYFSAPWAFPFEPELTQMGDFFQADGSTQEVYFMHTTLVTQFYEDELAQVLELPFDEGTFSMFFVLPQAESTLVELEASLSSSQMATWFNPDRCRCGSRMKKVEVVLPRFKLQTKTPLMPPLKRLGITTAFDPGKADFGAMVEDWVLATRNLYISQVIQDAFMRVNEAGAEAAAATAVVVFEVTSEGPDKVRFDANRPFLAVLRDNATGSTLFMARVATPQTADSNLLETVQDYFGASATLVDNETARTPIGRIGIAEMPWMQHPVLGWAFCSGSGSTNMWWWLPDHGWIWTTHAVFPFFWGHPTRSWYYLWNQPSESGPWFYEFSTNRWLQEW